MTTLSYDSSYDNLTRPLRSDTEPRWTKALQLFPSVSWLFVVACFDCSDSDSSFVLYDRPLRHRVSFLPRPLLLIRYYSNRALPFSG